MWDQYFQIRGTALSSLKTSYYARVKHFLHLFLNCEHIKVPRMYFCLLLILQTVADLHFQNENKSAEFKSIYSHFVFLKKLILSRWHCLLMLLSLAIHSMRHPCHCRYYAKYFMAMDFEATLILLPIMMLASSKRQPNTCK